MISDSVSCAKDPEAMTEVTKELVARGSLYASLGRGFSHPDEDGLQFLRACGEGEGTGQVWQRRKKVSESAQAATLEELQSAYMHLFDSTMGVAAYEVEHEKRNEFQKSQRLADIMGFYRAFGVEPERERPDHIACELEFMQLLLLKEAHAAVAADAEHAAICRDAGVKFFQEHLSGWVSPLLEAVRARLGEDGSEFYRDLSDLLDVFMEREKEVLK